MPILEEVPSPATDNAGPIRGAALAAILSELAAIPDEDVLTPRVDVPAAVLTALGAAPNIDVHRAAIAALFGAVGTLSLDRLVPLARALNAAHGEYVASAETGLEELARELADERARLVTDAEVLVRRKVLNAKALSGLIGGQGYKDRISDVTALVTVFRMKWAQVAPHTKVTLAELARAEAKMEEFSRLLGERDQASGRTSEAGRLRARAYTLFFRTYDHLRRMLTLLRWNDGDADVIAPSLYAGRTRSRDDEPEAPTPVVPVSTPVVTSPAVTTAVVTHPVVTSAPVVAPMPAITPVRPGMPGADPFQS